jgi:transposase-like protein
MNAQQDIYFKSIHDFLLVFPDEQACINHLEQIRWGGVIVSPFDETSKVYKCAGNKFKCKNTGKYFNAKTGTIFEATNIKLMKWFLALYVFSSHKKGISSYQLAKDIDVTQKSAWFMLHRLRHAFGNTDDEQFAGVVEVDETYVGGNEKNKHAKKKTGSTGRTNVTKTPVLGLKDRKTGTVKAHVVPNVTSEIVYPILIAGIEENSIVVTDEYRVYDRLSNHFSHGKVIHSAKEYVNGHFHTNGIENFWSHLKRGVDGIYHWVSREHLQSYVNEYALRYNTRTFTTSSRFDYILSNMTCRLTYKELTK